MPAVNGVATYRCLRCRTLYLVTNSHYAHQLADPILVGVTAHHPVLTHMYCRSATCEQTPPVHGEETHRTRCRTFRRQHPPSARLDAVLASLQVGGWDAVEAMGYSCPIWSGERRP